MDITYMIICDIKEYFEDWVKWSPYEDEEKDYQNRRKELNELIAGVEHVLMLEAYRRNKVLCISKSNIN
ncbi:MAG: hypothetical protein IJ661_12750 [Lachnospiraceae bacterium]|nr:hypothetical protein [Lachnospiraceae bacterium]